MPATARRRARSDAPYQCAEHHRKLVCFSPMPIVLNKTTAVPAPNLAVAEGLVAIGGDLGTGRLLAAYQKGIFPWTVDPITWWSPDPRADRKSTRLNSS